MSQFSIYIHWPFCASKCPYCDFNSHVAANVDFDEFANAYLETIDFWKNTRKNEELTSIYFGGGTPSLAPARAIDKILTRISEYWHISENTEITLEANPSSVENQNLKDFATCGINRLSLGVQSLNDKDLKLLGRIHTAQEAVQALEIAKKYFTKVNFDLIYARQRQTLNQWEKELTYALSFAPDHLSLYQLGIEENTVFHKRFINGKLNGLPDENLSADMFEFTDNFLNSHGYEHYEVSNFAKNNQRSAHNMLYWTGGEYLGIGPGAHGRVRNQNNIRSATTQSLDPKQWSENPSHYTITELDTDEIGIEYLLNAMRLSDGVEFEKLEQIGQNLNWLKLDEFVQSEHLWRTNTRFGATLNGRLILNYVILNLLPE